MTTASKESVTQFVLTRMENRGGFEQGIAIAYYRSGVSIHMPQDTIDTDNARKLRETFGGLFIKYGAEAEPLPTLREAIEPLLDQIRELGESFEAHAKGLNPKTKVWAKAQISFLAGAYSLASVQGNMTMARALGCRMDFMACFGRPAFTIASAEEPASPSRPS